MVSRVSHDPKKTVKHWCISGFIAKFGLFGTVESLMLLLCIFPRFLFSLVQNKKPFQQPVHRFGLGVLPFANLEIRWNSVREQEQYSDIGNSRPIFLEISITYTVMLIILDRYYIRSDLVNPWQIFLGKLHCKSVKTYPGHCKIYDSI